MCQCVTVEGNKKEKNLDVAQEREHKDPKLASLKDDKG